MTKHLRFVCSLSIVAASAVAAPAVVLTGCGDSNPNRAAQAKKTGVQKTDQGTATSSARAKTNKATERDGQTSQKTGEQTSDPADATQGLKTQGLKKDATSQGSPVGNKDGAGDRTTKDDPVKTGEAPKNEQPPADDENEDEGIKRAFSKRNDEAEDPPVFKDDQNLPKDITPKDPNAGKIVRLPKPDAKMFPDIKSLSKDHDVWVDHKNKRVVIQADVCSRKAPLELFACINQWANEGEKGKEEYYRKGTKEHEAILTINTTAKLIHLGLLTVGAEAGGVVQFQPKYVPARGSEIEVALHWKDARGKAHTARAQDWILNTKTRKAMTHSWVFAGSGFWVNEETGQRHYAGESGDLICVSNFDTAVMDLPIPSSASKNELLFEAYTERIPLAVVGMDLAMKDGALTVTKVAKDSPASRAGMQIGDEIVKFDYKDVANLEQYQKQLKTVTPNLDTMIWLKRGGKTFRTRIMPTGAVVTVVLTHKTKPKQPEKPKPEKTGQPSTTDER